MSVVSCRKMPERGGQFEDFSDTYQTYLVTTNSRDDDFFTVRAAVEAEVGTFGTSHPANPFYTRRNVRVDARTPLHWTAYVNWSTRPISNEEREREQFPNPIDRRVKMGVDSQEFQVYRDEDLNGKPYVNSAGDPLEAQPFEDSRIVIPISKNVASWSASWFAYNNTTNDSGVSITDGVSTAVIAAEYGLIKGVRMSDLKEENGYQYYTASAVVHIATNETYKWNLPRIDQGFYYLSGGNRKRFSVKDIADTDQDSPTEQLLDGKGAALGSGNDPVMLTFTDFKAADWSGLPFFNAVAT